MRSVIIGAAFLSILSVPAIAAAQDSAPAAAAALRGGLLVKTSDGKRVGRVERLNKAKDGSVVSVSIIDSSRLVTIPAETITVGTEGAVTSLTRAEVNKR